MKEVRDDPRWHIHGHESFNEGELQGRFYDRAGASSPSRRYNHRKSSGGNHGGHILKMIEEEVIKFAIITLWDSMDAVCQFAGDAPEIAVIPDEAKRLLSTFDRGVKHFEVIHAPDEIN